MVTDDADKGAVFVLWLLFQPYLIFVTKDKSLNKAPYTPLYSLVADVDHKYWTRLKCLVRENTSSFIRSIANELKLFNIY
jgi:hypothetical protein